MNKLNFIGIGGATNIKLGGNSSYLKEKDNLLIIDLCEGATEKLDEVGALEDVKNIYIAITHTHFDHIAGLGVFIWYSNFYLNIKPKIIYSDLDYLKNLKDILKLTGVDENYVEFIKDSSFKMNDLTLAMQPTIHTPNLQCYGIMFKDELGKYYYTGDTLDINYIKELCNDETIKRIYTEVATETYGVHIKYDDIKTLNNKEKIVLMHFDTEDLYECAIKDNYNVATVKKLLK